MPVDWSLVCTLLRQHHRPLSQVAKEVGSDWRHLQRLARGDVEQPRFATGVRLLDLAHDKLPAEAWARITWEGRAAS